MKFLAYSFLLVAVLFFLCGCSSGGTQTSSAANVRASYVVTKHTAYSKNSPAQPMPADGTFAAGTAVSVVKKIGNYTLVQAADGTRAYVASGDIAPMAK